MKFIFHVEQDISLICFAHLCDTVIYITQINTNTFCISTHLCIIIYLLKWDPYCIQSSSTIGNDKPEYHMKEHDVFRRVTLESVIHPLYSNYVQEENRILQPFESLVESNQYPASHYSCTYQDQLIKIFPSEGCTLSWCVLYIPRVCVFFISHE